VRSVSTIGAGFAAGADLRAGFAAGFALALSVAFAEPLPRTGSSAGCATDDFAGAGFDATTFEATALEATTFEATTFEATAFAASGLGAGDFVTSSSTAGAASAAFVFPTRTAPLPSMAGSRDEVPARSSRTTSLAFAAAPVEPFFLLATGWEADADEPGTRDFEERAEEGLAIDHEG
jgi:hypothetical protein